MRPLYFAGRDAELRKFGDKLRVLCASGESNGLQLTIGVPGSGKTRLADEFAKRVHGRAVAGQTVSALMISPEELGDPLSLFKTMGRAIDAEQRAAEIAQVDDRVSNGSGGALGASVAVAKDVGRHTSAFAGLLRESNEKGMWKRKTLVLLIDELRSIDDEAIPTLRVLHQGLTRCPILLLGFGLQHTAARLANVGGGRGIARIAEPTILRSLPRNDAVAAFSETLARLGPARTHRGAKRELGCLGRRQPGISAAHQRLLARCPRGFDPPWALGRRGAQGSVAGRGKTPNRLLQPAAFGSAQSQADDGPGGSDGTRPRLPLEYHDAQNVLIEAGFTAAELDAAIAHGALTCDDEDHVSFGIPSFHAHMKHLLDQERARERGKSSLDIGR